MTECFAVYSVLYSYNICIILQFHQYLWTVYQFIDWIIQSLCSPLLISRWLRIELPRFIYPSQPIWSRWDYGRFYTHFCNHSTTTTSFHTYLIISSQLNTKLLLFNVCFFLRSNWRNTFHMDSTLLVWRQKKSMKLLFSELIWLEVRRFEIKF